MENYLPCLEDWKTGSLKHILRYTCTERIREKLDWKVSQSDLCEVAKRLPHWRLLAPHLHITQEQEEGIVRAYPSQLELQNFKWLQKWSCNEGIKATYEALMEAVHKIGSTDLIDCICKLLSTQSSPPSHHSTFKTYAQLLRLSYSRLRPTYIFEGDGSGPSPSKKYINLMMTTRENEQVGEVDEEHLLLAMHGDTP